MFNKIGEMYRSAGQYLSALFVAPSQRQAQVMLFAFGFSLLAVGMLDAASAVGAPGQFNDIRIEQGIGRILKYMEGSFGALIMIASGLGAIVAAAFGQYRAALSLLVVAVGAFILRSLVHTFFSYNGTDI
jgi:type IV secretory pathway VirB2 component (pilin)